MSNQSKEVTLSKTVAAMIADRDALAEKYVENLDPKTGKTATHGGPRMVLKKSIEKTDAAIVRAIVADHGVEGLSGSGFVPWTAPSTVKSTQTKTDDELIAALAAAIAERDSLPEQFRSVIDGQSVRPILAALNRRDTVKVTGEKVEKVAAA